MEAIEFVARNPEYRIDLADAVLGRVEAPFLRRRLADMRPSATFRASEQPRAEWSGISVARARSDLVERAFTPEQLKELGGIWRKKTSGSSAAPAIVYYSRRFYLEQLLLNVRVMADCWKVASLDREVFSMTLVAVSRWSSLVMDDPLGETGLALRRVFDEREPGQVSALVGDIVRLRPSVVVAKPPLFEAVLTSPASDALTRANVRLLICSGAQLTSELRHKLVERFGCPVCNAYALSEAGLVAFECGCSQTMHLHNAGYTVNVDRPRGKFGSARGQVRISSSSNLALCLDRYATGDLAELQPPSECPCGSRCPKLIDLAGKSIPCWQFDGGSFDTSRFDYRLFDGLDLSTLRFRVRRPSPRRIEFLFSGADWTPHAAQLVSRAKAALGSYLSGAADIHLLTSLDPGQDFPGGGV